MEFTVILGRLSFLSRQGRPAERRHSQDCLSNHRPRYQLSFFFNRPFFLLLSICFPALSLAVVTVCTALPLELMLT